MRELRVRRIWDIAGLGRNLSLPSLGVFEVVGDTFDVTVLTQRLCAVLEKSGQRLKDPPSVRQVEVASWSDAPSTISEMIAKYEASVAIEATVDVTHVLAPRAKKAAIVLKLRTDLAEQLSVGLLMAAAISEHSGYSGIGSRPELEVAYVAPRSLEEQVLAEIWAEVLGVERVGVHDNFFELGGDSILTIQVVSRARAAGVVVTPKLLFSHQSVAELALVAGSCGAVVAEQAPVVGPVSASPVQRWFMEGEGLDRACYAQWVEFDVGGRLDVEVVRAALEDVVAHHDLLRVRVEQVGCDWRLACAPVGDVEVPVCWIGADDVLSGLPGTDVAEELVRSFDLAVGPLFAVALREVGDRTRVLMVAHHLLVDAVSWRIVAEDVMVSLESRGRGEPVCLLPKTTSFRQWTDRLESWVPGAVEAAGYWCDWPAAVGSVSGQSAGSDGSEQAGVWREVAVWLSEAETQALSRDASRAYRVQLDEVVVAALIRTLARWLDRPTVGVQLEGHGREEWLFDDVDLSRTVGWFTSLYPALVTVSAAWDDPGEAIKSAKEQLRAVPLKGLPYGVARYLGCQDKLAEASADVSFNFLGDLDRAADGAGVSLTDAGLLRGVPAGRTASVEVVGRVVGGRLSLTWTYDENVHSQDAIEMLAREATAELVRLAQHCVEPTAGGYTPSDFPLTRLDQSTLDRIVAGLESKSTDGPQRSNSVTDR
jgi:non-ribosomal peptide synthase protein (TIGR01720 family)